MPHTPARPTKLCTVKVAGWSAGRRGGRMGVNPSPTRPNGAATPWVGGTKDVPPAATPWMAVTRCRGVVLLMVASLCVVAYYARWTGDHVRGGVGLVGDPGADSSAPPPRRVATIRPDALRASGVWWAPPASEGPTPPTPTIFVSKPDFEAELDGAGPEGWRNRAFFFITRGWGEWDLRHEAFLSSLFAHHPTMRVYFVATTDAPPASDVLAPLQRLGYALRGVHLPVASLATSGWWLSDANKAWLQAAAASIDDGYMFSHLTDYLRFYVLSRWGGLYTDTDAIYLQPLPAGEVAGMDVSDSTAGWFLDPDSHIYVAPGVLRLRHQSPLAQRAMAAAFDLSVYDATCFNCVGPRVFNDVLKRALVGGDTSLQLLQPRQLYPLNYRHTHKLLSPAEDKEPGGRAFLEHLRRISMSIHLFGKMTTSLTVEPGSVIDEAYRLHKLVPDPATPACTLGGSRVIVTTGAATNLTGRNMVLLRDCDGVTIPGTLRLAVQHGHIELPGHAPVKEYRHTGALSTALVNALLASLIYNAGNKATDALVVEFDPLPSSAAALSATIPILVFHRAVTVVTHTGGRVADVLRLAASVQQWFPGTPTIASIDAMAPPPAPTQPTHLTWVRQPFDAGMAVGLNAAVAAVKTPYIFVVADGLVLDMDSHLDLLLTLLHTTTFDVVGATVKRSGPPQDGAPPSDAYVGMLMQEGGHLKLVPGGRARVHGCQHVDITPTAFMAKRGVLRHVAWSPELKQWPMVDFFVRAAAAHVQVLACDPITLRHDVQPWWDAPTVSMQHASAVTRLADVSEYVQATLTRHRLTHWEVGGVVMAQVPPQPAVKP